MIKYSGDAKIYSKITKYICDGPIPQSWYQPFYFKPSSNLLVQNKEGSCGLFASIQAYIHLYTMCGTDLSNEILLLNAVLEIMNNIRPCFVICTKVDDKNKAIEWYATQDRNEAATYINDQKWLSEDNATILFMYSIAILVGPILLENYAMHEPFILDDGNTNVTFVMLILSGEILDSFMDGYNTESGMLIKGTNKRQNIGLLSQNQKIQAVGNNFKNPINKIWVAFNDVHFTTIVKTPSGTFLHFDQLSHLSYFTPISQGNPFYQQLIGL